MTYLGETLDIPTAESILAFPPQKLKLASERCDRVKTVRVTLYELASRQAFAGVEGREDVQVAGEFFYHARICTRRLQTIRAERPVASVPLPTAI